MRLRILTEIKNLVQNWSQNCNIPNLYDIWQSEQIELANYEYINWYWWFCPKIISFQNLVPKREMGFSFYETWQLDQIKHNMLIKSIVFGIDDLNPKLSTSFQYKFSLRCKITLLLVFIWVQAKWSSLRCKFHYGKFDRSEIQTSVGFHCKN